jgi:hypothetical protein
MALLIGGKRKQMGDEKQRENCVEMRLRRFVLLLEAAHLLLRGGIAMLKSLAILVVVAVLVVAGAVYYFSERGYRIVLTAEEIEERVGKDFPLEKEYLKFVTLRLSEPDVDFLEATERVRVSLDALLTLRFPGSEQKEVDGACAVTFGLKFDAEASSFYLVDSEVESLDIEGVPPMWAKKVGDFAIATANLYLTRYPVYTIEPKDIKGVATTMVLQDVTVRRGKLVIRLGI